MGMGSYTFTWDTGRRAIRPAPAMTTTREQLAAAMIAVVAEAGRDHISPTTRLQDAQGRNCIMGAAMSKLGYPFVQGESYGGGSLTICEALGVDQSDLLLHSAVQVAVHANDNGNTWGFALDCFEAELAEPGAGITMLYSRTVQKAAGKIHGHPVYTAVVDEVQLWDQTTTAVPVEPNLKKVSVAWDTKPLLDGVHHISSAMATIDWKALSAALTTTFQLNPLSCDTATPVLQKQ